MKPVDQTVLRTPDDPTGPPGNCFAACIASILECSIDDVPHPTVDERDGDGWARPGGYWERLGAWLADLTDPAPSAERASAWMRRALTDPVRLWIELSPAARAAFAARVFYDGVRLSPGGSLSNPVNSLMLLPLAPLPAADPPMVDHGSPSANPADEPVARILSWVGSWRDAEAACLGVAA